MLIGKVQVNQSILGFGIIFLITCQTQYCHLTVRTSVQELRTSVNFLIIRSSVEGEVPPREICCYNYGKSVLSPKHFCLRSMAARLRGCFEKMSEFTDQKGLFTKFISEYKGKFKAVKIY